MSQMGALRRAAAAALLLAPTRAVAQLRPHDARVWSAAAVAFVGAALADEPIRDELRGPGAPVWRITAHDVEPLGRAVVDLAGLGTSYVVARLAHQPRWARATVHVAAGYLAADAVTAVLKPTVGRARPRAELGPHDFRAFTTGDDRGSFPSGHATHAFALAAGIAEEAHRPWVTAVAYGTAALVGWSRIHADAHWASDVVAGAVVGTSASLTTIDWLHRRDGAPAATPHDARTTREPATWHVRVAPRVVRVTVRF
ncbi:MAG TPA: phosphatase PAP2 family protein [Gemmatimonadaceae bacterium]|nr:phosphatase PAP2 family protein [Gemmatimonadaceae bacterium]